MEIILKKNAAAEVVFPMLDKAAPESYKTGETVTDTAYYHDGGSWTSLSITDAVSEIGSTGEYQISLTAAELNHDLIMIKLTATNSVDQTVIIRTTLVPAVWDEILSGATHNVATSAGRRLRTLQDFSVYEGGSVYIDTINGVPGTVDYENGTVNNAVDNLADAITIAGSVGLNILNVAQGSSIAFVAQMENYEFTGIDYTIAFGGQTLGNIVIRGANVSGVAVGNSGSILLTSCQFIAATTIPNNVACIDCAMGATITLSEAGSYLFNNCFSAIAGQVAPIVNMGAAIGNQAISFRHHSGGIELQNFGASGTDTMSLEGTGQLILNANCGAGGTIAIRGEFTVTDNASGVVTLSDAARFDTGQINDEIVGALVTDTYVEPPQGAPAKTASLKDKIGIIAKWITNKKTFDADSEDLYNAAGDTVDQRSPLTDDGGTFTRGDMGTGA